MLKIYILIGIYENFNIFKIIFLEWGTLSYYFFYKIFLYFL